VSFIYRTRQGCLFCTFIVWYTYIHTPGRSYASLGFDLQHAFSHFHKLSVVSFGIHIYIRQVDLTRL
jgi:hypothetical protein